MNWPRKEPAPLASSRARSRLGVGGPAPRSVGVPNTMTKRLPDNYEYCTLREAVEAVSTDSREKVIKNFYGALGCPLFLTRGCFFLVKISVCRCFCRSGHGMHCPTTDEGHRWAPDTPVTLEMTQRRGIETRRCAKAPASHSVSLACRSRRQPQSRGPEHGRLCAPQERCRGEAAQVSTTVVYLQNSVILHES